MTPVEQIARTHEAARCAYAAGLCVLPPVEDGTKRPQPVNGTWDQFKRERPSADLMRTWYPGRTGIGIVAGAVSGACEALDFDDRETYLTYLETAEAAGLSPLIARIENGYCDDTAGGGVRWLWRCPGVERHHSNQKLARRPKRPDERQHERDTVKVLIELPDYAIVAPSNGTVHPSGRAYVRRAGDFDAIAAIRVEERHALIELARAFDTMPTADPRTSRPDRRADGSRPGDDYTARTTWAEVLTGWTQVYTRGETTYWRRPGKAFGISATTNHTGTDRLHVFSSSTDFEPDTSYSRFAAFAVLEYGGDFAAAAKTLATNGYGTPHQSRAHSETASAPHASKTPPAPASSEPDQAGVTVADFYSYMPMHNYIFVPSREPWPAASVNARIPRVPLLGTEGTAVLDDKGVPKTVSATAWLDQHQPVEQMTWMPGLPLVVRDRLVSEGGWIDRPGCATFNLYRAPRLVPGDPGQATRWLDHVARVYPDHAAHIVDWLAHRVQRPHEKINHALVLGGLQGIGKDTLLEPVKQAVGPWNFAEVRPEQLLGRFNSFVKSVILRVSEARDLGDVDRYAFYEHSKAYIAAPPDVLRVDEKHLREYAVFNVTGVILTSNHKTNGLYLPADDRRHYVAWSDLTKEDFSPAYWDGLWQWFATGGNRHVGAYLSTRDLTAFNPKAPPPKTAAFWDIVDASRAPEDAELADVLEKLGNPEAVTLAELADRAPARFAEWLRDRKNARQVPHRMEEAGYIPVRNDIKSGLWIVNGKRQVVYAKAELPPRDRIQAARTMAGRQW